MEILSHTEMRSLGGRIFVKTAPKNTLTAQRVMGAKWDSKRLAWSYVATPSVAQALLDAFRGQPCRADTAFRELVKRAKAIREAQGIKHSDDLPAIPCTKTQPWLHQLRAYHFAYSMPACMLALDMGCGKSKVTVDLIVNRGHKKSLILTPKSVIQEWPIQFATHGGIAIKTIPLDSKSGTVKDRMVEAKIALHEAEMNGQQVALITNYETVWRDPWADWCLKAGFDLVACDEIHRIQSADGKASKYVSRLGDRVPYKLGLTGTPFCSGPLSIYGQYRFLDKGIFGTNFQRFRSEYAVMGGFENRQVTSFVNQEKLQSKFYSIAFRVESRDVLDLPDETHIRRTFKLSGPAAKAYRELEELFITQIHDGEVSVSNALVKLLRLQQITSGFVRMDDTPQEEGEVVRVDHEKQKLLAEVLDGVDRKEPVVVFARFTHDLEAVAEVCKEQGRTCAFLDGKRKQTEEWRNGEYDVLAVQIRAGGVGINLTRSHYCIYYSTGFSLGDHSQSLARTMRPGQNHPVTYYYLVAERTVDVKVYKALEAKQSVVEAILGSYR